MRHPLRTSRFATVTHCGSLVLLLIVAASVPRSHGAFRKNPPSRKKAAPAGYLNTRPDVGYVGSAACARCHSQIYHTYINTLMGRSMVLPDRPSAVDLPSAPVTIYVKKFDRYYRIFRRGSGLYQSEYQLGPGGASVFQDTRSISYLIGAGENGTSYVVREGSYLFEAPLSYYTKTRSWDLSPGYTFADYGFSRVVPAACIICHSGRPQPVSNRPGLYKDPPFEELAVGCENCHGPGQLHVEERSKGAPSQGERDRSIVNPADLSAWLADNVCMICHQGGDTRVLQPGKTYLDFRPGTPLDNTVAIFAVPFTPQSPPQDPLLQQYTQMTLSKCYLASGGKMSCITCHDPHIEPAGARASDYYRKKCLICHTEQSCKLSLSSRVRKSPPDDCIACHMPRQKLQRISHSSLTNHRIVAYPGEPFPSVAFHLTTPDLPDLVHVDAIPDSAAPPSRLVLLQAYGELLGSHPEYRAHYDQVLDAVAPAQRRNPLILSALGRRAMLRPTAEGLNTAERDIGEAIAAGSTVSSDFELEANLLVRSGKISQAIGILRQGIRLNPYSTRLYKRLALVYIQTHNYGDALETMEQELKVFPEDSLMRMLVARVEHSQPTP